MSEEMELICKCGGYLGNSLIGDEFAFRCGDCGRYWLDIEDWMKYPAAPEREFSPSQQALIDAAHAESVNEAA